MNKWNLLAGCAAVALGLGCGSALAQGFELKLGGDAYFEAGYVDQDLDAGTRSTEFRNRFRLVITPTAKADNGLEYGARLRLRANAGTGLADGDRAFLFAQGAFGRVEAGVVNGISDQTYVGHPIDWQMLGLYDNYRAWVNNPVGGPGFAGSHLNGTLLPGNGVGVQGAQTLGSSNIGTKINYFTPRFSGFQAGVSYSPRTDSVLTDITRAERATALAAPNTAASFQDIYEIAANYAGEFSGVGVKASLGYIGGSATDADVGGAFTDYENLSSWQAGLQFAYAGFALGGGYVWGGDSGLAKGAAFKDDYQAWNVGLQYTTGPLVVGGHYRHTTDAGNGAVRGDRDLDAYTLGGLYTIAPGLRGGLEYTYFDAENSEAGVADDNGSVILLRSIVNF